MYPPKQKANNLDTSLFYIMITLLFIFFFAFLVPDGYAHLDTHHHYAIEFSESCEILMLDPYDTTCGSVEMIQKILVPPMIKPEYQSLFELKNSTSKIKTPSPNYNHKSACLESNACHVYTKTGMMFLYSPENDLRKHFDKIITIVPNMIPMPVNKTESPIIINHDGTRTMQQFLNPLAIDQYCHTVKINLQNPIWDLTRLLFYLSNDCSNPSHLLGLGNPIITEISHTDIPITESPAWQILQELEAKKKANKENRIGKD